MRLVLASRNPHKVREFQRLLVDHEIVPLPGDVELPPESADTFEGNALPKARAAAAATGEPAIADDSGIEAAALNGAPGVRSARYAGEGATDAENLDRLRREASPGSALRYVCILAFVEGTTERTFEGQCTGTMSPEARGERGFGYDPVFVPDDGDGGEPERTMAELTDSEKDAISHRGRAARALAAWLSR